MVHDHLGAIIADSALLRAPGPGPLEGIEAVVKDCFAVAGHTSSFGLAQWRESHAPAVTNSAIVQRLLLQGADVIGLTELDQLAFSLVGNVNESDPPRNPRHPELLCGGSSSGSAAAVAGGIASLGIGTDTGGSIRVPAAMCGIHSLRPSWGTVDTTGCIPLAPSFDTVGLLAANPIVLRRCLAAVSTVRPTGGGLTRVLVDPSLRREGGVELEPVAARVASALSSPVEHVSLGHLVNRDVASLFSRLQGREIWSVHGSWVGAHPDAFDDDVARRLDACREFAEENAATVEVDEQDRRMFTELLAEIVGPGCVLVLPVLGGPGPRVDDPPETLARFRRDTLVLAAPASLAGWPEITWSPRAPAPGQTASVGLLAAPGSDFDLVHLLEELWASETSESAQPSSDGP